MKTGPHSGAMAETSLSSSPGGAPIASHNRHDVFNRIGRERFARAIEAARSGTGSSNARVLAQRAGTQRQPEGEGLQSTHETLAVNFAFSCESDQFVRKCSQFGLVP